MQHFTINEIKEWDRFYRANFINSLQGFKPVSLLGTVNENGQPNLAIFSNIVHLGADPALIGFINRPVEAAPHTLHNIEVTGQYTINHIQPSFVAAAHQTSAKYPADQRTSRCGKTRDFTIQIHLNGRSKKRIHQTRQRYSCWHHATTSGSATNPRRSNSSRDGKAHRGSG